jgi:hypothetical protein
LTVGKTAAGPRPAAADAAERGLYGRERELGAHGHLLGQQYEDAGGALVVRGEAGIGKSALLAAVTGEAREHWPNRPRPARTASAACHSEPRRGAGQPTVIQNVRGTDRNWRQIDDLRALSTRIRQQTPRE